MLHVLFCIFSISTTYVNAYFLYLQISFTTLEGDEGQFCVTIYERINNIV